MFIINKNTLFIVGVLFCVPLFGMSNTKKAVETDSLKREQPALFWKPVKVLKISAGVGAVGFVVGGAIPAVISSALCFELIEHKTRRGTVVTANAHIAKCNAQSLQIAKLAKRDAKHFMEAIKQQYGLPKGLLIVNNQLKANLKNLTIASDLLKHSFTVNPDNLLKSQQDDLKNKKHMVDLHIQDVAHALELLKDIPISKL